MPENTNYGWYQAKVSTKKYNDYYSKIETYTFLAGDKNYSEIGFCAVIPPDDCLEITNLEDLRKIDIHYRANNIHPRPFYEKTNTN